MVHNVVTSKYFDLAIAAVIGLNVVTMAMEFYLMPKVCHKTIKINNGLCVTNFEPTFHNVSTFGPTPTEVLFSNYMEEHKTRR